MGSVVSLPTAISLALIAGGIIYGFVEKRPPPPAWNAPSFTQKSDETTATEKKKGKKKKGAKTEETSLQKQGTQPTPNVVEFPAVVPGGLEPVTDSAAVDIAAKTKSKKKKKAKRAGSAIDGPGGGSRVVPLDTRSESSATAPESSTPVSRPTKRKSPPVADEDGSWTRVESRKRHDTRPTPSDTGITTSVTDISSPVIEPTEDEHSHDTDANHQTLAEKLLPRARKTGVEE